MRSFGLTIISIVPLLFSSPAYAQAGYTGWLTPQRVYVEDSTNIILFTTDVVTTSCGTSNAFALVMSTEGRVDRAYSTFLTAMTTGRKLRFYYNGTCHAWSYPNVTVVETL